MILKENIQHIIFSMILFFVHVDIQAQDTFSIVAVDSTTGEVGSAGASCVDLFRTSVPNDHFIGELIPGVGAINTQAYYIPVNQDSATQRMLKGDSPDEIIKWLIANDVQSNPNIRQYGVAAFVNGSPKTAAHTGSSTDDYKGHIAGVDYSIQGNILLGKKVLDSMESKFLNAKGDLACKLMASLQGANMVGADSRCASNGTSSLFAYVKVAKQDDQYGNPSFVVSVRTQNGAKIEPIDSLQNKFDQLKKCGTTSVLKYPSVNQHIQLYPNPVHHTLNISVEQNLIGRKYQLSNYIGQTILEGKFNTQTTDLDVSVFKSGVYALKIEGVKKVYSVILQ